MGKRVKSRELYYHGKKGVKFGVWNGMAHSFQFGICEDSPALAEARLHYEIGDDAFKWRFEIRELPRDLAEKFEARKAAHKAEATYVE